MQFSREFDPFQVFKVEPQPCQLLQVTVIRGRRITKGRLWDIIDKPDPYVELRIPNSPTSKQRTQCMNNTIDPMWNETFVFLLKSYLEDCIIISLKEANTFGLDTIYGEVHFSLSDLQLDRMICKNFFFDGKGQVEIEFYLHYDCKPDMRFSLCLCDEEKEFRERRRKAVYEGLLQLLPEKSAPSSLEEVPVIAVIGSGGGFRAMAALSGVFNALESSGVLDCTTYCAGLSGSAWYLSTLYSDPDYPRKSCRQVQQGLRDRVQQSMLRLMLPGCLYSYVHKLVEKRMNGMPISFTDFFGLMVGHTLIPDRLQSKLSDQRKKLEYANLPMPLYCCLNAKKEVSTRIFREWLEFSPFEIGLPKYGCFLRAENFGSKFFMGRLCKSFEEPPLYFLQGIWGSAFTILVKDLLRRDLVVETLDETATASATTAAGGSRRGSDFSHTSHDSTQSNSAADSRENQLSPRIDKKLQSLDDECRSIRESCCIPDGAYQFVRPDPPSEEYSCLDDNESVTSIDSESEDEKNILQKLNQLTAEADSPLTWWETWRNSLFAEMRLLNTMSGRAAMIHNFMRGLTVTKAYPIAPFTPTRHRDGHFKFEESQFSESTTESLEGRQDPNSKYLNVVDAGLAFNSPFPSVLRQQRAVDLILSFDFSGRKRDDSPPIKELMLAYKWALLRNVPFPKITLENYQKQGTQEVYIFRDKDNPRVPIIMHFVLVNLSFREFKKPNLRRTLQEEINFANFKIFGNDKGPYTTTNFVYSPLDFDRLSELMEYNTLNAMDKIKKCITECIDRRRRFALDIPIDDSQVDDFLNVSANLGVNKHDAQVLGEYISKKQSQFSLSSSANFEEARRLRTESENEYSVRPNFDSVDGGGKRKKPLRVIIPPRLYLQPTRRECNRCSLDSPNSSSSSLSFQTCGSTVGDDSKSDEELRQDLIRELTLNEESTSA